VPAELVYAPGPVLAFNGLHVVLFLGAGISMAWLAGLAERVPEGWFFVVVLFLIVMPHVFGLPHLVHGAHPGTDLTLVCRGRVLSGCDGDGRVPAGGPPPPSCGATGVRGGGVGRTRTGGRLLA
jgi:hypothetical protein